MPPMAVLAKSWAWVRAGYGAGPVWHNGHITVNIHCHFARLMSAITHFYTRTSVGGHHGGPGPGPRVAQWGDRRGNIISISQSMPQIIIHLGRNKPENWTKNIYSILMFRMRSDLFVGLGLSGQSSEAFAVSFARWCEVWRIFHCHRNIPSLMWYKMSPIDHLPGKQFHWSLNNPWWQLNAEFGAAAKTFDLTFNGTKVEDLPSGLLPIHVLENKFAQNCHSSKIGWDLFFKEVEDDVLKTRIKLSCGVYFNIWLTERCSAAWRDGCSAHCMLHAAVLQAGQLYFLQGWVAGSQAVTGGLPSSEHVARCAHTYSLQWPEQNYAERGTDLESAWINH